MTKCIVLDKKMGVPVRFVKSLHSNGVFSASAIIPGNFDNVQLLAKIIVKGMM